MGRKQRVLTMQDVRADLGVWHGPWGRQQRGWLRGGRGVWGPWQQGFCGFNLCGS